MEEDRGEAEVIYFLPCRSAIGHAPLSRRSGGGVGVGGWEGEGPEPTPVCIGVQHIEMRLFHKGSRGREGGGKRDWGGG